MHALRKSLSLFYLALYAMCFITLNTSCTHNKCYSVSCVNGGVCNNGSCTCPVGYQGATCQTISRDVLLGNWTVSEKGNITEAAQYPMSIVEGGPNINDIAINNFLNSFTTPVNGYVIND